VLSDFVFREEVFDWILEAESDLERAKRSFNWRDYSMTCFFVSNCFERVDFWERYPMLRKLASEKRAFEIIAYTPRELLKALEKSIVVKDASTYWVEIS